MGAEDVAGSAAGLPGGRLRVDRLTLDWERVGAGEPVALLHARPFVDWYQPLMARLAGWSVLRYRREVGPTAAAPPFGLAEDAAAFEQLAEQLGMAGIHLVGHSYGGLLALEIARRRRVPVRSLALIEPAGSGFLPPERAVAAFAPLMELYRTHGGAAAIDSFLSSVCGAGFQDPLDAAVPGAWAAACRHADQFFRTELPAVSQWVFGPDDASTVDQPALVVTGTASDARFLQAAELLQSWLPNATRLAVPDANHLLLTQAPDKIADALVSFWTRT